MVTVKIEVERGKLRLRWTYPAKTRHCFALGYPATPLNIKLAEAKALAIERDIAANNFDYSLARYRPESSAPTEDAGTMAVMLQNFIAMKTREIGAKSAGKYVAAASRASEYFPANTKAASISFDKAADFRDWLTLQTNNTGNPLSSVTVKERLQCLSACWEDAIERKMLTNNPWKKVAKFVKKIKSNPKPLDAEQIPQVINGFRADPEYSFYADLVAFLLGSGARFGEVAALTWGDVSEDFDKVYFGKTASRGDVATTKNEKTSWVPMSKSLITLLQRRKRKDSTKESLIFPSRRSGGNIHDRVFRHAWVHVLRANSIPYRKPYSTRSTLISHWLSQGEDIATVAALTRTSIKMIQEHYAGSIKTNAVLPDLFVD
jgi:integrase